ncbi:hypothetical protein [Nocardiopsis sp. MG754419]|uniref:hypothetical protein n=1 Tax=Nocardiopsis sp. MG754419 TaxID=2259865 RepID=UPI001BAC96DD|nr:hypothetical protein [Nocardiopsis sp. MG754419]MBR8741724.1 hypothetical protein [Nocardiopsis sp. MG754419]
MAVASVARATARLLERRYVTRSGVTRIGGVLAVVAAVWFSRADLTGAVAGSVFLGSVLFCDAVRSRMRAHRRDALTLWVVSMAARLREYAVYVGLAFGAAAAGYASAWGWAAGALIALALRDALLVARAAPPARSEVRPLALPGQVRPGGLRGPGVPRPREEAGAGGAEAARAAESARVAAAARAAGIVETHEFGNAPRSLPVLTRRIMAFEQPTRFLVIAVATVAWDARIAFVSLIVGCAVAITGELVDPTSNGADR